MEIATTVLNSQFTSPYLALAASLLFLAVCSDTPAPAFATTDDIFLDGDGATRLTTCRKMYQAENKNLCHALTQATNT